MSPAHETPTRDTEITTMYAIVVTDLEIDRQRTAVDWSAARCRDGAGTLTHLFFADDLLDIARAKAICAKCTASAACLAGALERAEPWGVWGGELLDTGRVVTVKRPRGRPPTRPRPVMVVDEDRSLTHVGDLEASARTRIAC